MLTSINACFRLPKTAGAETSPKALTLSVSTARRVQVTDSAILVGETRISGWVTTSPQLSVTAMVWWLRKWVNMDCVVALVSFLVLVLVSVDFEFAEWVEWVVGDGPMSSTWKMSPLTIWQLYLQKKMDTYL